jgi:hypothetical protein
MSIFFTKKKLTRRGASSAAGTPHENEYFFVCVGATQILKGTSILWLLLGACATALTFQNFFVLQRRQQAARELSRTLAEREGGGRAY